MISENEVIMDIYMCFISGIPVPLDLKCIADDFNIDINLIKKIWEAENGKTAQVNGGITGEEHEEDSY